MQERLERAYEEMAERGEKPPHDPKEFEVIDEIKDPRELVMELRAATSRKMSIDDKITFLEEVAAQNGGLL